MYTNRFIFQSFEQLLREKNFESITVADIIEASGVSRGTFYRYFKDKYELLSWYYIQYVDQLQERYPQGNFRALLIEIFTYVHDNVGYYQRIQNVEGQNNFWNFLHQYTIDYYTRQLSRLRQPTPLDEAQIQFLATGDVDSVRRWVHNGCAQSPEEMADFILSMLPSSFLDILG